MMRLGSVVGCVCLTALPLVGRFQHDTKVVTFIDEAGRNDRQHLGVTRPGPPHQNQHQPVRRGA